ncbi:MAG: DJ-1/PfpI family protein [Promethearchaeota archaeon]
MRTYVLLYDGFVHFEIAPTLLLLKEDTEIYPISVDEDTVTSYERLRVVADMEPKDVNPEEVDFLLIPGGDPRPYSDREDVNTLIREVQSRNVPIAAICGGPGFLAQANVIKGKRITHGYTEEDGNVVFKDSIIVDESVVVDGNIITAQAQAFVEFAVEIKRQLGLFENEDEAAETLSWLRNEQ